MGIKEKLFSRWKKESTPIENPPSADISPSPPANQSLIKQVWQQFQSKISRDKPEAATQSTQIDAAIERVDREVEGSSNRVKTIIQRVVHKDEDENTAVKVDSEVETNPNRLQKFWSRLRNKDLVNNLSVIQKLESVKHGKIQALFHKFVKSANPKDIQKIAEKLPSMNRGLIKEIWPKIQSLFQMIRDPSAAWTSKALAIGSLLYLISPVDAIPDVIPVAGLADDATLIISVVSSLAYELSKYAKQSADKGIEIAEELADIEVRKYNRIVRITLTGSIIAAVLAIAVKLILKHM